MDKAYILHWSNSLDLEESGFLRDTMRTGEIYLLDHYHNSAVRHQRFLRAFDDEEAWLTEYESDLSGYFGKHPQSVRAKPRRSSGF